MIQRWKCANKNPLMVANDDGAFVLATAHERVVADLRMALVQARREYGAFGTISGQTLIQMDRAADASLAQPAESGAKDSTVWTQEDLASVTVAPRQQEPDAILIEEMSSAYVAAFDAAKETEIDPHMQGIKAVLTVATAAHDKEWVKERAELMHFVEELAGRSLIQWRAIDGAMARLIEEAQARISAIRGGK